MNKSVVFSLFLFLIFSPVAQGDDRTDLKTTAYNSIKNGLVKQLLAPPTPKDSGKIEAHSRKWASLIDNVKGWIHTVPADQQTWLAESLVSMANVIGVGFIVDDTPNPNEDVYYKAFKERLTSLDSKALDSAFNNKLLWSEKSKKYDEDFRSYIVSIFEGAKIIEITGANLDMLDICSLAQKNRAGVDRRSLPERGLGVSAPDNYNFSADHVSSNIALTGLVGVFNNTMSGGANSLWMASNNLISPAFQGEQSLARGNDTSLSDVIKELEKHSKDGITKNGEKVLVDFPVFNHFLWEAYQLRYRKFAVNEMPKYKPQSPLISLKNDPSIWRPLLTAWSAVRN